MNKNGAPMQWQVTPYFIHFAQTLSVKAKFRNRLKIDVFERRYQNYE